ncbi:glycosyltransferase family 2 protein [Paenibacillus pinistramenti]|uniref:glycosyltransferase family 2 protein n=1 Tax=Paenibacillus pinistramenti TaxID=1768003 RepID=UPI001109F99D|nr:glycosyltransferase family 2 protein [Paenibacillus pinistramenti]
MEQPLVSILMPTYNRPEYFEQALASAFNQTYKNIEIVVSDNSTNDLTQQIVEKYQAMPGGSRIRYYRNKENIGPIANQQRILNRAQGKYVNYLNDDDLFHPQKIEKMMHYFLKHKGIVLVTSQRRVIDDKGNRIYLPPLWTFKQLYPKDTIVDGRKLSKLMLKNETNYLGEPTTVLFKKSALKEPFGVLAGKQVFFAVDLATWLNLLTQGKGVYMVQPLSYLRYHSKQLSQHKYAREIGKLDYKTFKRFAKMHGFKK